METFRLLMVLLLFPISALAGVCDTVWDGDKLGDATRGLSLSRGIPLRNKDTVSAEVTVGQIQAFYVAKKRISVIAILSPSFSICDSSEVNAFAGAQGNGQVVGITIGMLKLVDGNPDMAAAVIGHELAHHVKGHAAATQAREKVIGLLGLIVGGIVEYTVARGYGITGTGDNVRQVGSSLVNSKFSRDQEREADQLGFEYMVRAGFNPNGAIQLANRMNEIGAGGIGLFFDSHPGWSERESDFRAMIAANPEARRLAAGGSAVVLSSMEQSPLPLCPGSFNAATWTNCVAAATTAAGDKYVGEVKDGKYNGQGTYTYANGNKYVGEWKDGKFNGQGASYHADGTIIQSGTWENGNFVSEGAAGTEREVAAISPNMNQSQLPRCPGSFNAATWTNCIGEATTTTGNKYVGEFKDGKFDGVGTEYRADGSILRSGTWWVGGFVVGR